MDVGIGLPIAVRGVDRAGIVEWAIRAERHGFSTLGTLDRLVYPNYEALISLAAAAALTERIRLMTDILIAPLHTSTALLAKQTATIDSLSGGRLTLGLAVGGRKDDYVAAGADFRTRGRTFDAQLEQLRRHWAGEGGFGPPPRREGGPEVLIGGGSDVAFRRAARHGDGWTMGGGGPAAFAQQVPKVHAAWEAAGREGRPRTVALFYFALGYGAPQVARSALGDYYAFLGDHAERVIAGAATDEDAIRATLHAFEQAGADEVICFPTSSDPAQVDLLARVAL